MQCTVEWSEKGIYGLRVTHNCTRLTEHGPDDAHLCTCGETKPAKEAEREAQTLEVTGPEGRVTEEEG